MEDLGANFMEDLETLFTQKLEMYENEGENDQCKNGVSVTKPVHHQFYFVKFWPLEKPKSDAKIREAEKVIERMNQEPVRIADKIREKMTDQNRLDSRLRNLYYRDEGIKMDIIYKRKKLELLEQSLDKLCFANNAYRGRSDNSCLSVGEVDHHKLNFQMLHGSKSMAEERKLLREISESQKKNDAATTFDELNAPIRMLQHQLYFAYQPAYMNSAPVDHEALNKKKKQHEISREKAIANAAVHGKLWNSLGFKKDLQDEVKGIHGELDRLGEKQLQVRAITNRMKKEMEVIASEIISLGNRLTDRQRKKEKAYESILKLKKQYGEENACYYEYCSILKKATALAEKKDIEALKKLSQTEVDKFMYQWNNCEAFRGNYKKRIVPSLNCRRLVKTGC